MPNYLCQDRERWASYPDCGVLFDYLLAEACKTCFYPMNAGDLCPDCQRVVDEERRRLDEQAIRQFDDMLHRRHHVHVYGVGTVDTWTEEGRRYLDDY